MKKKMMILLVAFTMIFAGCGSGANDKTGNDTKKEESQKNSDNVKEDESEDNASVPTEEDNTEVAERSLADLEQYMLEKGCLTGERTEKAAEMLGAVAGFGYDCGVEIYQYDTSSDTYASVAAGEEIPLQGMDGFSIKFNAVNGEFALYVSDETNLQTIVDAFNAY